MLSATSLLYAWEEGWAQPPPRKGVVLLEAAHPEGPADGWAAEPVPRRDAALLELREAAFGSRMNCAGACPSCREQFEFGFDTSVARGDPLPDTGPFEFAMDGYLIGFRLPNSWDLLRYASDDEGGEDTDPAVGALMLACVDRVVRDGEAIQPERMPPKVKAALAERIDEIGRGATIELSLTCPSCGHDWTSPLDIVSYLWAEVDAWARQTFVEIHVLASVYGWTEAEILALSARRRRLYVEMVQ